MLGIDSILRTLLGGSLPWFVATAVLLGWEIQSLSQRGWSAAAPRYPNPFLKYEQTRAGFKTGNVTRSVSEGVNNSSVNSHSLMQRVVFDTGSPLGSRVASKRVSLAETLRSKREAIIVVGCLNTDREDEVELTLSMEPSDSKKRSKFATAAGPLAINTAKVETFSELVHTSNASMRVAMIPAVTRPISNDARSKTAERLFFLQSPRGSADGLARHEAISCRLAGESRLIRVYVEQSNSEPESLEPLIAELLQLADEIIGPRIRELVGPVCDCDADGKLAVVLSRQLNLPGGMWAGVEGVTQASDFRSEVPRPLGNQSDVIFLSTRLPAGERLRAILTHEWGHAAIFSRRYCMDATDFEPIPTEDDWLNEALTHLVEVRVGGTSSNVTHRQQAFLERTAAAPLIVRDYTRPEFWRHHGCRGAAMSFLEWCHHHSGPQIVNHLAAGHEVGIENLERATGESFDRMFHGWTTSLGQTLAHRESSQRKTDSQATDLAHNNSLLCPKFQEWHPAGDSTDRTITLRLKETTAAYVKLRLDDSSSGCDLMATSPGGCRFQLSVIPIESAQE